MDAFAHILQDGKQVMRVRAGRLVSEVLSEVCARLGDGTLEDEEGTTLVSCQDPMEEGRYTFTRAFRKSVWWPWFVWFLTILVTLPGLR